MPHDDWAPVVDLIERVVGEDDLLSSAVGSVRATVREVAPLSAADIAGHTRALLAAATRALAARRGPTEAELSFVEELAVARARQGIPIEAVLMAIHVAERSIWSRARELAEACGVAMDLLFDARELYDDWAEAVRSRLITAHHAARITRDTTARDRNEALLRRLLDGGSAATLAAAEAGLPATRALWVLAARADHATTASGPERLLRDQGPALCAITDDLVVGVLAGAPTARARTSTVAIGLAGPADPEGVGAARRQAVAALAAAEAIGRTGVIHIADVAVLAAVADRADLAAALSEFHRAAERSLGAGAEPVARAVCAWLEANRDTDVAAESLFVHPNTVRNRVHRFAEATGIDPAATFGGVNAWWLCHAWLTRGGLPLTGG